MTVTERLRQLLTEVEDALDEAECFASEYHETAKEISERRRIDPITLRDRMTEWAEVLENDAERIRIVLEIVNEYAQDAEDAEREWIA